MKSKIQHPEPPQFLIEDDPQLVAQQNAITRARRMAKEAENGTRGAAAQAKAEPAFARLLELAETRRSGQIEVIAKFLAATYNGRAFAFDFFELRVLERAISDDMLACLDCLRWSTAELYSLVPDGGRRVDAVIDRWHLRTPH